MRSPSRRAAVAFIAAGLGGAVPVASRAQAGKPLRILVGYTAGGAVDVLARAVGEQLHTTLDQPVVVENRPGAGTNLAVRALIDSAPDGQTLLMAANALAANGALFDPPPFDVARDVAPVAMVGRVPVVIAVSADSKLDTLAKLIDVARSAPRTITYATPGNGSTPHLAMGLFEKTAGVSLVHVPYKGGAQAITDVLGGHVQLVAVNALEALPHARAGKLKVLAVMSRTRTAVLPDVPTIAESGWPQFEASVWYGLVAPARTPAAVIARLNAAVQQALASPAVKQRLLDAGGEVTPGTPEQFGVLIQSERVRYEKLIREAGIKPD
jgi:tripartite-type tricarboxylate transporter receptor subunit TctC